MKKDTIELTAVKLTLQSIVRDLKMIEQRVRSLEGSIAEQDTVEIELEDDFDGGYLHHSFLSNVESYDTMKTKKDLEQWRKSSKVVVDEALKEEEE